MITSPHNEKLKLVRSLRRRRARRRRELFVTEGEDLVAAGRAAGHEPVELLTAAGAGLGGTEVEPALLDRVSELDSGTRAIGVWRCRWASEVVAPAVFLHGIADPGNLGTIVRTAQALVGGTVVLGPGCADPFGPRAARASMGAVFSQPLLAASLERTPEPRAALVAHGGSGLEALGEPATLCVGAEREGLPAELLAACATRVTIPMRPGAESLNVAAATAIALQRISSPAETAGAGTGAAKMGDRGDG